MSQEYEIMCISSWELLCPTIYSELAMFVFEKIMDKNGFLVLKLI